MYYRDIEKFFGPEKLKCIRKKYDVEQDEYTIRILKKTGEEFLEIIFPEEKQKGRKDLGRSPGIILFGYRERYFSEITEIFLNHEEKILIEYKDLTGARTYVKF